MSEHSNSVNVGGRTVAVNADGFEDHGDGGFSVKGEASTRMFQLIALRRMLKLEIETGMRASRGTPMTTAAQLIGSSKRTKRGVYAELDKFIVKAGGQSVQLKGGK